MPAIDVAMPSYGVAADTLRTTLRRLSGSLAASPVGINRLVVDYRPTTEDTTPTICNEWGEREGVVVDIHYGQRSLPESRVYLCERIDTDWFLFLDDDVWLRDGTLTTLINSRSPAVGAVQVRKARHEHDDNADWSKWRNVRGTTFATLIRTACVADVTIPDEITQLEDEYLRQHIENEHDKLWLFQHQAVIDHDNQGRHEINYQEGELAAKYGLLPYDYVYGNVIYNVLTRGHPVKHAARALGYTVETLR